MAYTHAATSDRIKGAVGAILVPGLIGYALLTGLAIGFPQAFENSLQVFAVAPEAPPPPPVVLEPAPVADTRPEGAAAPPNIRSTPTQVVAPPQVVPLPPPPVIVAARAGEGVDPSQGAAETPGPGTGAGGVGDGTGSGGRGDSDGAGGIETPPRWRSGRMSNRDFPAAAADAGISGKVHVRYLVLTNGRVGECEIERSSGSRILDETTCRLIRQRYRFAPSRDERGRPVNAWIVESHEWIHERIPAEPEDW
ncbi:energy transducer TonB [Sphingomonas sp.]